MTQKLSRYTEQQLADLYTAAVSAEVSFNKNGESGAEGFDLEILMENMGGREKVIRVLIDNLRALLAAHEQEPVAFVKSGYALCYYRPPQEYGLKIGDQLFRHPAPSIPAADTTLIAEQTRRIAEQAARIAELDQSCWTYEHTIRGLLERAGHAENTCSKAASILDSGERMALSRAIELLKSVDAEAPEAPSIPAVVPEEITQANAPEVHEIVEGVCRLGLQGTYGVYAFGWNACRAAMLNHPSSNQASDNAAVGGEIKQSSSNGGWIPVSERLPEEGGRYWCYVEEQNSLGKSHYQWNCSWNGTEWSDAALTGRVTHWQPLPAEPKV